MKKLLFIILTLSFIPQVFAESPDYRISPYKSVVSSSDTAGAANTATQLSQNTAQSCMAVHLCASRDNAGIVAWGGSNVHWNNGPGTRLGGEARASCDLIYVDNLQDIYISAQTAGDDVNYNYFK